MERNQQQKPKQEKKETKKRKGYEVVVETDDVIKEYNFGSYSFLRCKTCIVFKTHGGFSTVVGAQCISLYRGLDMMLGWYDLKDTNELTKEQLDTIESFKLAVVACLEIPMTMMIDEDDMLKLADERLRHIEKLSEELLNRPLQDVTDDDEVKNSNFEFKTLLSEAMGKTEDES